MCNCVGETWEIRCIGINKMFNCFNVEEENTGNCRFDSRERKMEFIGESGSLYSEHPRRLINT